MIINCTLKAIRLDGATQPRTGISEQTVAEYAEALLKGDTLPPVVAFWDGTHRWLADGFHRVHAHRQAGSLEVAVDQRDGTRRDAVLYSVGANAHHGLRRSDDDKRKAVRLVLEDAEWGQWTDRRIAEVTNTSATFVGKVRASLKPPTPSSVHVDTGDETSVHVDTQPEVRKSMRDGKEVDIRVAPRTEAPAPAPASDGDGPSAAELLDEMAIDLKRAEARTADLEKALQDGSKEQVVTLLQRLDHAERRQAELMEDAKRWQAKAEFYGRLLARCGKAVGDRDLDNVAAKVEAMARKMRDMKVAA